MILTNIEKIMNHIMQKPNELSKLVSGESGSVLLSKLEWCCHVNKVCDRKVSVVSCKLFPYSIFGIDFNYWDYNKIITGDELRRPEITMLNLQVKNCLTNFEYTQFRWTNVAVQALKCSYVSDYRLYI